MFDLLFGDECAGEILRTHESALQARGLFVFLEAIMERNQASAQASVQADAKQARKKKRRRTAEPANLNDRQRVEWKAAHPKRGDILSCFSQRNGVSGL